MPSGVLRCPPHRVGVSRLSGLLLCDAVDSSTARKQWAGVNHFNNSAGVHGGENLARHLIVGIPEPAHDHSAVANVVIDIGVVDRAFVVGEDEWSRDSDQIEPFRFEASSNLGRHLKVGVYWVPLVVEQHRCRVAKSGDNVDVSAGAKLVIVASESALKPHHTASADRVKELALDIVFRPAGVSTRIELHGLCDENNAVTVRVNASTLIDER